jgi:hypothetical protein
MYTYIPYDQGSTIINATAIESYKSRCQESN